MGESRNENRLLFPCLVQYRARGKCPSFPCKDFFTSFLNCSFTLMIIFNWTLQSVPSQSNNMWQGRHFWSLNQRVRRRWVCCVPKLHWSAFSSLERRRKRYRLRHEGTGIRMKCWCTFIRTLRHLYLQWQRHWQSHRWHYWHELHTVDWKHKLSTYCTCSPQVYRWSSVLWQTQPPHTNKEPSPLSILTAR
jgi:hypothetical protein